MTQPRTKGASRNFRLYPDSSDPFGKSLNYFPRSPEDRKRHFRSVLMTVILPTKARGTDKDNPAPTIGGYFERGRYRGISRIRFPLVDDAGIGIRGDGRVRMHAPHESPRRYFPRRLWLATGGLEEAPKPDSFPADVTDYDPAVAFTADDASGDGPAEGPLTPTVDETLQWNSAMDAHCAYFRDNRIAYLSEAPEFGPAKSGDANGFVTLRAVETLRFTGCDRHHSDDFIVLHLALENPTADQVVNFVRSLRTGEKNGDLRPTPRYNSRANIAFCPEGATSTGSPWLELSVPELLEFHAKLAVLGKAGSSEKEEPDDGKEEDGEEGPDGNQVFYRLEDGRLVTDREVPSPSGDIIFDFRIDRGHLEQRKDARKENDAFDRRRIFTLSCAIPYPDTGLPPHPMDGITGHEYTDPSWTRARQWGQVLAGNASRKSRFPEDSAAGAAENTIPASTGWLDCMTEFGFATIRTTGDLDIYPDPFRLCQTRYVEMAILALRQLYALEYLTEEENKIPGISGVNISTANNKLKALQEQHLNFRRELWFCHVPRRPSATHFLTGMQNQLGIDRQLADLAEDLALRFEILNSWAREVEEKERERKSTERNERRAAEQRAFEDEQLAREQRQQADAQKRELLNLGLAIVSVVIAIPSFSAVAADPSWTNFGVTLVVTLGIGAVLIWLSRIGWLGRIADWLIPTQPGGRKRADGPAGH